MTGRSSTVQPWGNMGLVEACAGGLDADVGADEVARVGRRGGAHGLRGGLARRAVVGGDTVGLLGRAALRDGRVGRGVGGDVARVADDLAALALFVGLELPCASPTLAVKTRHVQLAPGESKTERREPYRHRSSGVYGANALTVLNVQAVPRHRLLLAASRSPVHVLRFLHRPSQYALRSPRTVRRPDRTPTCSCSKPARARAPHLGSK